MRSMLPFLVLCLAPVTTVPADEFDGAQWLRDPRAAGHNIIDYLRREREKPPKPKGPKNLHTLLRREITLREKPAAAVLTVTADDYAHFYVNGYKAVQGPESGYPFAHPYYHLDITPFFEKGVNCLAAHVYYQGLLNRVWNSADNRSGFMMALDIRYPDGGTERHVTDGSWRCFPLMAFESEETTGYQTQFLENIDMRLVPQGWRMAGFDDSAWQRPATGRQDHVFVRQITPPLERHRVVPAVAKDLGGGRFFYDFGQVIVGHTRVRTKSASGHVMTVRHGEELSAPDTVRFEMRAKCRYEEKVTLSGRDETVEFYDYRTFRYMEILDAPAAPEVWVEVRHHPFNPGLAAFSSGDREMGRVWDICRNGVWMGSQGGFLDCPSREKGQYLGDAVITARSHLWLTADPTLTRKALHDFALSQRICPGMMAVAPGSFMQEIAEYSLQYPLLLREYYWMTGDRAFAESTMDAVFGPLFGYFAGFENRAGLLEGISKPHEKWVLIDWPENMRDEYDYEYGANRANAVLNGFYYGALRTAAALSRDLGRDGGAYDARAEKVAAGFAAQLADPATGLYLDAPGSRHSSLHANAVPLSFGLHAGADREKMLAFIREKRLSCGVYIAPYVIEACFRNGAPDLGYALLSSDDERSWKEMLRHGATTCMEAWGPEQKWNTSWCHPWSSSPVYLLPEQVFGLTPAGPGWTGLRAAPPRIADLPEMTLRAPLPGGRSVIIRHSPGGQYVVSVPAGLPVEVVETEGVTVMVKEVASLGRPELTPELAGLMERSGWAARAGDGTGILVSVPMQRLWLIEGGRPVWQADCATAAAGTGFVEGSGQTPTGWHRVSEKFGEGAPWGQVFRSRAATKEIWKPGRESKEDLVLTRLLWLEGLEPGVNLGKDAKGRVVDSKQRHIYLHGTNGEAQIGTPSSHGCVRLLNDDVIILFDRIPEGAPVYIAG